MTKKLPVFLDSPERQTIGVTVIYSVLCFFSLPFLLLLFMMGMEEDFYARSWFDIAFHVVNFLVIGGLFREYLRDSLDNATIRKRDVFFYAKICGAMILGVAFLWYILYVATGIPVLEVASYGTIPISEMNLFNLPSYMITWNPVFGTLCMVVLAPLTTCCIYYAAGFVPAYNVRPWLGYLVMAAAVAFPRICNAMTFWDPVEELVLYVAQLPVHIIACWGYRKTDTIWTPILAHVGANLVFSVIMIVEYLL